MAARSCEMIAGLLASTEAVQFKDLQAVLGNASRATTFRYLKQVPYQRSYNHNGRYYSRNDPERYDRFGLFSCGDIHSSRDRTLTETIKRLVQESVAGWTSRELQDLLHVGKGARLNYSGNAPCPGQWHSHISRYQHNRENL